MYNDAMSSIEWLRYSALIWYILCQFTGIIDFALAFIFKKKKLDFGLYSDTVLDNTVEDYMED